MNRIAAPSREDFEKSWVRPARPVLIHVEPRELPNLPGDRMVPVARTRGGVMPHDAYRGYDYDRMRLDQFLARSDGYSIFPADELLPEVGFSTPQFLPKAPWILRKLWLSAADIRSPLHQDLPDNLYAQLAGKKRVTLFSPDDTRHLHRQPLWSRLPNFSQVDAEAPDLDRFPRFRRAQPIVVVLEPGDLLYVPRRWWHQMRSLERSVSLSTWWATGATFWAVRAALLYQRLRGLRY